MKKLSLSFTVIALGLSMTVNAKGLFDALVDNVVDKVSDVVRNGKQSSQAPVAGNSVSTSEFQTPYTTKCSYEDQFNKINFEFDCIGERVNKNTSEIVIKTKEPIKFNPAGNEAFNTFLAKESDELGWQIYGIGKNNQYVSLHSFWNATGGGAGAPELLVFNNGDGFILLTINMLNPLGD